MRSTITNSTSATLMPTMTGIRSSSLLRLRHSNAQEGGFSGHGSVIGLRVSMNGDGATRVPLMLALSPKTLQALRGRALARHFRTCC